VRFFCRYSGLLFRSALIQCYIHFITDSLFWFIMKHQQAAFLQEMGITHWQVRKPALFTTDQAIKPLNPSVYKLLVICTEPDKTHPLMSAIIDAFAIDKDSVAFCSLFQFEQLQGDLPELVWSTLGDIKVADNVNFLSSPSLAVLNHEPDAKKSLWKQFCAYRK